jgi:glycosyltransferase involved in cell wall biosynthesis
MSERSIEVSVVLPCLNEAETLASCIRTAERALHAAGIDGEIVVADNGSSDGSAEIALSSGARVVRVERPGYGSALMGGIGAARGRYVIMGDADDSYDFGEIARFVARLRDGYALVQGCRLPSGGGTILPGAMRRSHRLIGNPLFSFLVRHWFQAPVHDVYCGLRGFTRELYDRLDLRCLGMEFATEMILKASLFGARIAEVPITLRPDGRRSHAPHLRTVRDGWRTLVFFLLCSPRWLYLVPGSLAILAGLVGYALAFPGLSVLGANLDAHTLLFSTLFVLAGHQAVLFGIFARIFAVGEGLLPPSGPLERVRQLFRLESGLTLGGLALVAGAALLLGAIERWRRAGFGDLDYAATMRWVIPGVLLALLGIQTVLASFLLSMLGLQRR